jgi:flagellar export protein FliJ
VARFVFRLEVVLRQRQEAERARKLAVAELEQQRLALEEQLRACQAQIVREKHELRDQLAHGGLVDLRGVRFQAAASLRLVAHAQRAVLQLAGLHKRLDAARLELLQATVRRKAVELLRQRRLEAWDAEQKRRENAAADELSVMQAHRREDE